MTYSTVGGLLSFAAEMTEGRTECCVGVRGEESMTDAGEDSELEGDDIRSPRALLRSGGTEVASESVDCVISEPCWEDVTVVVASFPGAVRVVDVLPVRTRGGANLGLEAFCLTVLGWLPVVDVRSVPSASSSRTLERDAVKRGSGVMRVPLSTLRRPASISL